ncbi:MAG: M20/M25/M40 family metallo-hydrolase [Oscillospiraceae bacterium]|nr:M20/M25/M40 family metallo-hydrolase [Oscillospiraceae bacterium]
MEILVNRKRIENEFAELVSVDALSFGERHIADILTDKLKAIGFEVYEDSAGNAYGGNAGNIYGYLPGSANGDPVLFSAHMDTVSPGIGKKTIFHDDGMITSEGDTVLGADDVSGLTEILEGIRCIKESGTAHRAVEVLFPIGEEVYLKGTDKFDFGKIKAKEAYVLDLSGDVGSAAVCAPSLISFQAEITGKAAHAGFAPENGVHAVSVMSKAISRLKQGHIDEETTFNIGTIGGGTATNIVPEKCVCTGEVRSFRHDKALAQIEEMEKIFSEEAECASAEFSIDVIVHMEAYRVPENAPVTKRFLKSCETLGFDGKLVSTFGGSDNHNFMKHGISGIVLSCGMYDVHSVHEYTKTEELIKGAELVAQLILAEK